MSRQHLTATSHATLNFSGGLLAFTVLLFCLPLLGQEGLSTVRGTVTDSSGAVVPGAQVTIQDQAIGVGIRIVATDGQGNYEIPALKSGTYRVTVERSGFKTFTEKDFHLASNQIRRADVVLQVGATSTQVTVSGAATVIQTESGRIGSEISGDQYRLAPMPANSYSSPLPVLATMPQIQTQAGNEFGVTMAGQGGNEIHMGMDGVKEENLNTQTVNMEDAEEVNVNAVNNSAEYARVGYYDVVTKRGTNQYHGEVSYYHRNSALGARGFFEDHKPLKLYHTFNISGSGPIIRDRTFFYGLWNAERVPEHSFFLTNVPTAQMRSGDFSGLLTSSPSITIFDPLTGQPFPGNMIPVNRLNPLSVKIQNAFFPLPNEGPPGNLVNNFGWDFPYPNDQYHADVVVTRIDHKVSDKNSIYGRYSGYWPRYVLSGGLPALNWTRLRQSHSWAFVDTHLFTPSLVNTFTFGGNRDRVVDGTKVNGFQPVTGDKIVAKIGLQGVNPANYAAMGIPAMHFNDIQNLIVQPGGSKGASELQENWTFADSLTWAKGRHVVKFGGELRAYMDYNAYIPEGTYGSFFFNGNVSGFDYADFLLGLPFNSTRLDPLTRRTQSGRELGLFVTDTFKVTRRLTIDYGLRWDHFGSFRYDDGLQYNFDPATGHVVVPPGTLSKIRPLYPTNITVVTGQVIPNPTNRNFAPRLSAAYRITENTVIRGGYGIFTSHSLGLYPYSSIQGAGPFQLGETYTNTIQNGQPLFAFPDPFPPNINLASVPSQAVAGLPLQTRDGHIHQFNVTVERQVHDIGFRLSYVSSRSRGINFFYQTNKPMPSQTPFDPSRRPYPQFVSASALRQDGAAHYDSLTLEARRRVGQLSFDWFWTWANNLDNMEIANPLGFNNYGSLSNSDENPYVHLPWSHDAATPHHRVVLNTSWDVPIGRERRFLASMPGPFEEVFGGWTLNWIGFLQTGQWFSPQFSTTDPSNTNSFGGLPDRIANGNVAPNQRAVNHWFATGAFKIPGCPDAVPACANPANVGRFGNSGVNILEGPGLNSQNLTVRKRLAFTERWHLDVMAMCGNLFNHPNFYPPASTIDVPGAGVITGQHDRYFSGEKSGARVIEGRLRLEF